VPALQPASEDAAPGRRHAVRVPEQALDFTAAYARVRKELDHAYAKHGKQPWGRHEFYAILLEEVDELWDAVKADEPMARVQAEAVQVAAVVFRYLETGDRYGWK
jgi:NTP pyrophosphatase (non-canonical NTP hydrolase)